jgi:alkaline phosphatase D
MGGNAMAQLLDPKLSTRRRFLRDLSAGAILGGHLAEVLAAQQPPALIRARSQRPATPSGVMSGDISAERAVLWSRTDRPARMMVEYSTTASFKAVTRIEGPVALATTDFTARVDLSALPPDQTISYRVSFVDLTDHRLVSAPLTGTLLTPSRAVNRDLAFTFSGDEAGQGFGINPDLGGYRMYEVMRQHHPDFFIHSGDQIYADGPLSETVTLDDGAVWRNLVTPAKATVAQTLDDFRGNFAYNLLDDNKRRFAAEVPFLVQWDDHETHNNWYPGQIIEDARYTQERRASVLAAYANRALLEYNPIRWDPQVSDRLYRACDLGRLAEVFLLDLRSQRSANSANRQAARDPAGTLLGRHQLNWLKARLAYSRATWKIIACDMPLGLVIPERFDEVPPTSFEGVANGDHGKPSGREHEIAELLRFIKERAIHNVVWITADVHYAAAFHYHPERAQIGDFLPFWEFIAGPINAGTFGPNALDHTFGPRLVFQKAPPKLNRSPRDGLQFFGLGRIDHRSRALTISLRDLDDRNLFEIELPAASG